MTSSSTSDGEFVGELLDLSRKAQLINAGALLKLGIVLGEEGEHDSCMDCLTCGECIACGDCPCEEPQVRTDPECERHPVICDEEDWQGSGRRCDRIKGHKDPWHWENSYKNGSLVKTKWLSEEDI